MLNKRKVLGISITLIALFFLVGGVCFGSGTIKLFVNASEVKSDVPAQIIDGRVMVPVRFVADALGADVSWQQSDSTVNIKSGSSQYKLLKINNQQTTFPYWEEKGTIYIEANNCVDLIRRFYSNRNQVAIYDSGIYLNGRDQKLKFYNHDNFRTVSLSQLDKEAILKVKWDDKNKNLSVSMP